MIRVLFRAKSKLTHRHYAIIITTSSVACGVVSLHFPEYNGAGAILATMTNIFWVWE